MPTVEFAVAPATEAFRTSLDLSIVRPAADFLKGTEGVISVYYGLQHEEKTSAYLFVAWETLAHHHKLIKDPEQYPKLIKEIGSAFDLSGLALYHVEFTSDPYGALEAPVTEVATFTLLEGQSKNTLQGLVADLANAVNAAPESTGAITAAWGPTVEKDDLIVAVIGWTSVEAHWALVTTSQQAKDLLEKIKGISTIHVKHVALAHH